MATDDTIPRWEESLLRAVNELPGWIEGPGWIVMQLGSVIAIPVATGACIVLWRDYRFAARVAAAGVIAWLITRGIKAIVARDRPDAFFDDLTLRSGADGSGFSSGHAAVAFALATVIATGLTRRWRWLPWTIAGLAGFMRVYTAVHFPLDVLGGWGLGLAVGGAIDLIASRRRRSPD